MSFSSSPESSIVLNNLTVEPRELIYLDASALASQTGNGGDLYGSDSALRLYIIVDYLLKFFGFAPMEMIHCMLYK